MKAITIRQPWAHAIVSLGKDIENRDWPTHYRGRVLIHAGKSCGIGEWDDAIQSIERILRRAGTTSALPLREDVCFGGIVAVADLIDCVTKSKSPWFFGSYGFVLRNVRPLPFVSFRGLQKFFEVPDDLVPEAL